MCSSRKRVAVGGDPYEKIIPVGDDAPSPRCFTAVGAMCSSCKRVAVGGDPYEETFS